MRCFTILGPSQSGKSTLASELCRLEGQPAGPDANGPVSFRPFSFLSEAWCAFDVAGGPENLGYAGRALAASDAAILCVPPDPDAAVLTAPYLRLVETADIPCLIFINRMDAAKGRIRDIVAALQPYSRHTIVLRQVPIRSGGDITGVVDLISERAWKYQEGKPSALVEMPADALDREREARTELLEHLADYDDALLEQLIEDRQPAPGDVYALAARVLRSNSVIPAFLGAASHSNGILRLMKGLRHECPTVEVTAARLGGSDTPVAAGVYADIRKHLGKSIVLRALGDGLKSGAMLGGGTIGSLTALDGRTPAETVAPGDLAIAVKSDHLNPGQVYSATGATPMDDHFAGHPPAFDRLVTPASDKDDARLSTALARMQEIDPGLSVTQDEATGHAVVRMQGPMHLRRVFAGLQSDFGVEAVEGAVPPTYRETISKRVEEHYRHRKQSGGAGQFADVSLIVEPRGRGDGFQFAEVVKGGVVPRNYIPAVEAGAVDATATGPLGFPVVDVAVTLTDGKHHAVDSSDFAFRTAGRACVQQALQKAGPVLLQPIDRIEIHVPSVFSGALVTLVSSLKGQVLGFDAHPDCPGWDIFRALLPAASHEALNQSLGGASQGTAWYEAHFDHYEEVHGKEAERVAKERAEAHA